MKKRHRRRRIRRRTRFILVVSGVLLFLIACGALLYQLRGPIKKVVNTRQSKSLVVEANRLIEKEQWQDAYNKAFSAHLLDPSSYPAMQAFFKSAQKVGSPHVLILAASIVVHAESSTEEKIQALTLIYDEGDDNRFMQLYNGLSEDIRNMEDVSFLKAEFMVKIGQSEWTREMVDKYLASGGDDLRFRLMQISLLLKPEADGESLAKGQKLLIQLIQEKNQHSKEGLDLLWSIPIGLIDPDLFPRDTQTMLDGIPGIDPQDELAMAKVELARLKDNSALANTFIRETVARFRDRDPESLAIWLDGLGQLDLVLEVLDETRGMISVKTYDLRLKALTALKGPEAAGKWLEAPHEESSPMLLHLSKAQLAGLRNEPSEVFNEIQGAFFHAGLNKDRKSYLQIFNTAMQLDQLDEANEALVEAAQLKGIRFPPVQRLGKNVGRFYEKGDFRGMRAVFAALANVQPNRTNLNNLAYATLIVGEEDSEGPVNVGRKLMEQNPLAIEVRTTLALGLMQQEEWDEAAEILSVEESLWEAATPAAFAIHSILLEQQGKTEEARKAREKYDPKSLTQAERDAFSRIRRSFSDEVETEATVESFLTQAQGAATAGEALNFLKEASFLAEIRNDRDSFVQIYTVAMKIGQDDFASRVLGEAARRGGQSFPPFEEVAPNLPYFYRTEDFVALQKVLEAVLGVEAANVEAASELAYVMILQGSQLDRAVSLANSLAGANPELPGPAATLAFGLMNQGNWDEAYRVLGRKGLDWNQASAAELSILEIAVERQGNQEEVLRQIRGMIPRGQLTQAELKAFDRLRRSGTQPAERASSLDSSLKLAKEAFGRGDKIKMSNLLRGAFSYAELANDRESYLTIFAAAKAFGQTDLASMALVEAGKRPGQGFPSGEEIKDNIAFFFQQGDFQSLRKVLEVVLTGEPNNVEVATHLVYSNLVLGYTSDNLVTAMGGVIEKNPELVRARTTMVLGLMQLGMWKDAHQMLVGQNVSFEGAEAADYAIIALALDGVGKEKEAEAIRSRLQLNSLSRTERDAFSRLEAALSKAKEAPGAE